MRAIKLNSIFPNLDPNEYKIHFARKANDSEPLDVFIEDFDEWKNWNMSSGGKDSYNRKFIFSLINFYPEADTWLFGGVWEVISKDMRRNHPYEIKLVNSFKPFIGRLKLSYCYKDRTTRARMENHFDDMVVKEILEEPYFDEFPGYKNVDLSYDMLKSIFEKGSKEWKNALSVKGIYLITDTKNGKKYVGKADGANGLWQRWKDYKSNGHGGDVELEKLVHTKGFEYVKKNFWYTILEVVYEDSNQNINDREEYWKRVLMTRDERFGYNKN